MILIVTGSREITDVALVESELNAINDEFLVTSLHVGDARGVDTIAKRWAEKEGIEFIHVHYALWKRFGNSAGMIRNKEMIDDAFKEGMTQGEYIMCLAIPIPSSIGTKGAMKYAQDKGIETIVKTFQAA